MSSESDPALDLGQFLPYKLAVLADQVAVGIARTFEDEFGLSSTQWRVLVAVAAKPGVTAGEVSEMTPMDKVAVSRAVSRLVEQKLIRRQASASDGRVSLLEVTARGKSTYGAIWPRARAYDAQLQQGLTERQRRDLLQLLERLLCNARAFGADDPDQASAR